MIPGLRGDKSVDCHGRGVEKVYYRTGQNASLRRDHFGPRKEVNSLFRRVAAGLFRAQHGTRSIREVRNILFKRSKMS